MFNCRLLKEIEGEKILIFLLCLLKLGILGLNVTLIFFLADFVMQITQGQGDFLAFSAKVIMIMLAGYLFTRLYSYISYFISIRIKGKLRKALFEKVYGFKQNFGQKVSIAKVIQTSVEGIEQLNLFYAEMLPQVAYSILAPLLLFMLLYPMNRSISLALLAVIPAIPLAILLVQTLASRVVKSYWKSYTNLAEVFIDFLYGMTTLKIFEADEDQNQRLNNLAEDFRKKTMKLLMVQLNNITAMDLVAYLGTGLGIVLSISAFLKGEMNLRNSLIFILLSQEFFTPLRQLGSLFHVAMTGISAAEDLYTVLEMEEKRDGENYLEAGDLEVRFEDLDFSYTEKTFMTKLNLNFKKNTITALVGRSGSGKSTIAKLIMGQIEAKGGEIYYGEKTNPKKQDLLESLAYVDNTPYFFTGSLAYNLRMAKPDASEEELWKVLDQLCLAAYFKEQDGLNTKISESGSNLSGGQKQRLAIARVLLKGARILVLDEAISNIDAESEEIILELLEELKKNTNIILITHRLKNTRIADYIYFLDHGKVVQEGLFNHVKREGVFAMLYQQQEELEKWGIKNANL